MQFPERTPPKLHEEGQLNTLNYKHLRYFWVVAKSGGIARAAQQLHLTPHTISGQLGEFQETLGVELLRRAGRGLELTDAGRRILGYAEDIFTMGDELLETLRDDTIKRILPFRVGVADSVSKSVAYQLVEPALRLEVQPVRLVCREGRLTNLLAELAIHRLDMIIADRPMPANLNVRGYSHLLGESSLTVFGAGGLAQCLEGPFPSNIDKAPFLLPGEDVAIRHKLIHWAEAEGLRLRIVGEFDDSALIKSFGQAGAGLFVAPTAMAGHVCEQYKVVQVGRIDAVKEQVFAITAERRITHPAVAAISRAARQDVFKVAGGPTRSS
jgi:LysR family transcriptional activator of nhaA